MSKERKDWKSIIIYGIAIIVLLVIVIHSAYADSITVDKLPYSSTIKKVITLNMNNTNGSSIIYFEGCNAWLDCEDNVDMANITQYVYDINFNIPTGTANGVYSRNIILKRWNGEENITNQWSFTINVNVQANQTDTTTNTTNTTNTTTTTNTINATDMTDVGYNNNLNWTIDCWWNLTFDDNGLPMMQCIPKEQIKIQWINETRTEFIDVIRLDKDATQKFFDKIDTTEALRVSVGENSEYVRKVNEMQKNIDNLNNKIAEYNQSVNTYRLNIEEERRAALIEKDKAVDDYKWSHGFIFVFVPDWLWWLIIIFGTPTILIIYLLRNSGGMVG